MQTIFARDFLQEGMTDDACIAKCIQHCKTLTGERTLVLDGKDWHINDAILLSSDMTLLIDGCTVKQNDLAFDNVVRGENHVVNPADPFGAPLSVTPIKNIRVIGRNGAKIIGCDVNRRGFHTVLEQEQDMTGDFWGWRTLQICLSMCDGFEIAGISFLQTRCWAMSFELSCNGYIHDLHFDSHVKNGDGIDFRAGCHHCRVENITGYTSDDTVACTALWRKHTKYPHKNYLYPLQPALCLYDCENLPNLNIHHISISNVFTSGEHHGIICLAAGGLQIHNISITNIVEGSEGNREATVKVYTGYGDGYTAGDLHDIAIDGVVSNISKYAVLCNTTVSAVTLNNIIQNKPDSEALSIAEWNGITLQQ